MKIYDIQKQLNFFKKRDGISWRDLEKLLPSNELGKPIMTFVGLQKIGTEGKGTTEEKVNAIASAFKVSKQEFLNCLNNDESESVADMLQVLGYVDAGKTEMYIDQTDSQFETETLPYKDGYKYIGFRVRGPSMLPRFKEGEVIIFYKNFEEYQNLLNDEVLISLKNGARLIKIFKRNPDGGFLLVSHNPAFEDIAIQEHDILEVRRFKGIDR